MSDFSNELGKTLDKYLRLFPSENYCAANLIEIHSIPLDVAKEILFALYRRDFIQSVDCKTYKKAADIQLEDFFRISIEGVDYLELHKKWWTRFWFSSLACPAAVSLLTSLLTNLILRCLS